MSASRVRSIEIPPGQAPVRFGHSLRCEIVVCSPGSVLSSVQKRARVETGCRSSTRSPVNSARRSPQPNKIASVAKSRLPRRLLVSEARNKRLP
jgi:hypothetical protein